MEQRKLTNVQKKLLQKYLFNNYVQSLNSKSFRLSKDEILEVERATRNQSKNLLWNMLRLDRQTASSNNCASKMVPQTAAMSYGLRQEQRLKTDRHLIDKVERVVESTLSGVVIKKVLECGMFLSHLGLFSASPDAYFVVKMKKNEEEIEAFVPIEIKCPHTYKDKNINEVIKSFGDRKNRYRIKHTALSVNKNGSLMFAVTNTDPHYRQMQRQMYVLNAPLCVYIVKFSNSYVVCTVNRDETFCLKEKESELCLFNRFVCKNHQSDRFKSALNRTRSIVENCSNEHIVRKAQELSDHGLYYDYDMLHCVFCDKECDVDMCVDRILETHRYCGDTSIRKMSHIHNIDFISHKRRLESLANNKESIELANDGIYHDGKQMLTFCCGVEYDGVSVKHNNDCKYILMLQ